MPTIFDLPNEILDIVFSCIDNPTSLYPLLFNRKLNQSARKAIYDNLRITVWDPASQSARYAHDNPKDVELHICYKLLSIKRLRTHAEGFPRLFERTSTVTMRLSEKSSNFLRTIYRPRPEFQYTQLEKTALLSAHDAKRWDEAVTDMLKLTLWAKDITIDWFGEMPLLCAQAFPQDMFRQLRSITIRGVRDASNQFYGAVPDYFHQLPFGTLELLRYESVRFDGLSVDELFAVHQALADREAAGSSESNRSFAKEIRALWKNYRLELLDCQVMGYPMAYPMISDAQIIFDQVRLNAKSLSLLPQSSICLKTLELQDRVPPGSGKQKRLACRCYAYIGQLASLSRLKVSFWITPRDHAKYHPYSLADFSMESLKQLELCIGIHDLKNMRRFEAKFMNKLRTIEELGVFPVLEVIKLVPSLWISSSKSAHYKSIEQLLNTIMAAWNDESTEEFFGWKKLVEHGIPRTYDTWVFSWQSGVVLDVTEIFQFLKAGQEKRNKKQKKGL